MAQPVYYTKRARDLVPGDVVFFVTRPLKAIAELRPDVTNSRFYPHRPYKVVWVRWVGEDDFTWKTGASDWVAVLKP